MSFSRPPSHPRWGNPPWSITFQPAAGRAPETADFAVVGGGFAGLSAAAGLRKLAPGRSVVLFEADGIGAGSSGHTGGLALAETAAGDLPGLGDVLSGFSSILRELEVDCDLALPGVYEIGRSGGLPDSPISWADSGNVRAIREVPGGMIDPGKMVSGLARAAESSGTLILENTPVEEIEFGDDSVQLHFPGGSIRAGKVFLATNAMSLELNGLSDRGEPKFTIAVATEPLPAETIDRLGLSSTKPFYTVDLPYLWGRLLGDGGVAFGAGLVHLEDWRELSIIDVRKGEAAALFTRLEARIRGLHPALRDVRFTHRWGGPILIADEWRPVFARHPKSANAVVLGAFSGHGVAQSVYLGRWAAEALCGLRTLPDWKQSSQSA